MSLIIKGMKLPENDGLKELVIGRASNGTEPIAIVSGDITEFYKIIEIPTHGRLIDADVLIKDLQGLRELFPSSNIDYFGGVISLVENSPTIIEVEVSE